MSVSQELVEQELGRMLVKLLDKPEIFTTIQSAAEHKAVQTLQRIQDILNDSTLNDFWCVEEIVTVMEDYGLTSQRHDFG